MKKHISQVKNSKQTDEEIQDSNDDSQMQVIINKDTNALEELEQTKVYKHESNMTNKSGLLQTAHQPILQTTRKPIMTLQTTSRQIMTLQTTRKSIMKSEKPQIHGTKKELRGQVNSQNTHFKYIYSLICF